MSRGKHWPAAWRSPAPRGHLTLLRTSPISQCIRCVGGGEMARPPSISVHGDGEELTDSPPWLVEQAFLAGLENLSGGLVEYVSHVLPLPVNYSALWHGIRGKEDGHPRGQVPAASPHFLGLSQHCTLTPEFPVLHLPFSIHPVSCSGGGGG